MSTERRETAKQTINRLAKSGDPSALAWVATHQYGSGTGIERIKFYQGLLQARSNGVGEEYLEAYRNEMNQRAARGAETPEMQASLNHTWNRLPSFDTREGMWRLGIDEENKNALKRVIRDLFVKPATKKAQG